MDAFDVLRIQPSLTLAEEQLREALRAVAKERHPDADGDDQAFAALNEALAVLSSPSQRLRHWLRRRGLEAEIRGSIDSALIDLFSEISTTIQQTEVVVRQRDEARSALARALLENQTQLAREAVEKSMAQIEQAIIRQCANFSELEQAAELDLAAASAQARSLAFLEKWRAQLRSCFARLV